MRLISGSLAVFLCSASGPAGLHAAELCVTCAEPAANYRCGFDEGPAAGSAAPGLQLSCIVEIAKRWGHKACSIDRTRAAGPCDAPLVLIARPQGLPLTAPPGIAGTQGALPPTGPAPAPAVQAQPEQAAKPPETVEALAKEAAQQTKRDWDKTTTQVKDGTSAVGRQFEKAGDAVGGAVKKSWNCIVSLFSGC